MQLVAPAAAQLGYEVVDVEYVKKKNEDSELIIYIDREGGVDLDDCEACGIVKRIWEKRWMSSCMKN